MTGWLPATLLALAVLALVGVPVPPRLLPVRRRPLPPALLALPLVLLGPVVAVLGLAAVTVATRVRAARRRASAQEAERAAVGEVLDVLIGELEAGRPPEVALKRAADVGCGGLELALRNAAASPAVGADPALALRAAADGSAVAEVLRSLATCWQVCAGSGSSLAAAIAQLAQAVAAQEAVRREVAAEVAGPRATATLLAGLPLLGLALAAGLGAHPLQVLLQTPLGLACLVTGLGLDALGWWWTGRIVASVLPP